MATSTDLNKVLLEQIYLLYTNAENQMLDKVAKRVKNGIKTTGWNETKLADIQKLRKEINSIMNDTNKIAKSGMSQTILNAYTSGIKGVNRDMGIADTIMKDINIPLHLQKLILDANNLLDGTHVQILRNATDVYRDIITNTSTGVLTGTETINTSAQKALNEFAAKGITGFIDKAGRKWELASYVDMALRTSTAHAALQGHIDRQVELGIDLVVVSKIGTTCPICAEWQGKILSISGNSPNHDSLNKAKEAGLFHPNCKHTISAFFKGMAEFDDTEPHRGPNDEELYKATQRQRYIERQIRKYKRLEAVALTPNEKAKASNKVREWQSIQRNHINEFNLRRNYNRERLGNRIGNPDKGNVKSIFKPLEKPPAPKPIPLIDVNKVTEQMKINANNYTSVKKWYDDLNPEEKVIIKQMVKEKKAAGIGDWPAHKQVFEEIRNANIKVTEVPKPIKVPKAKPTPKVKEVPKKLTIREAVDKIASTLKGDMQHVRNLVENDNFTPKSKTQLLDNLEERYSKLDVRIRRLEDLINKEKVFSAVRLKEINDIKGQGAYYQGGGIRKIVIDLSADAVNKRKAYTTFIHEFGHHLDHALNYPSRDLSYLAAIQADYDDFIKKAIAKHGEMSYEMLTTMDLRRLPDCTSGIQDAIGGLSLNTIKGNWMHSTDYWKRGNRMQEVGSELYAHITSAMTDEESFKYMKEFFPRAVAKYEELLEKKYIEYFNVSKGKAIEKLM